MGTGRRQRRGTSREGDPVLLDINTIPSGQFVHLAYQFILQRLPDPSSQDFVVGLDTGAMSRTDVLAEMVGSAEFLQRIKISNGLTSIHRSRSMWTQTLPRASKILDLGGSHPVSPSGMLVELGYPYRFDDLCIVDLPADDRFEQFAPSTYWSSSDSPLGPVRYVYQSMVDLSNFEDASFDLVFCGQAIEHIDLTDAHKVFAEAHRVLRPGGAFCFDTPNSAATALHTSLNGAMINPDHRYEWTASELAAAVMDVGFELERIQGLNYIPESFKAGRIDPSELAKNTGVFNEATLSYVLAVVCTKPRMPSSRSRRELP